MAVNQDSVQSPGPSLTLRRGLRTLRVLAEHPEGLSVSELARTMGTHRAGVYRLLGPLAEEGLVRRDDDGRYTLGMGLVELASHVHVPLQEVAVPELQRLADRIRATTALTVQDGDEAVVAAVLAPRSTDVHLAYRQGLRHRLDQAASGIAILASLPPVSGERSAVATARRRGWARSAGELLPGTTGIGVPIVGPGGRIHASISAVWLQARDEQEVAKQLIAAAARIESRLRGRGAGGDGRAA